jgi:hypothetical protein
MLRTAAFFPVWKFLKSADLALISVRRRTLLPEQMQIVREFISSENQWWEFARPSHSFCLRDKPAPEGRVDWKEFDREVIGGSYTNHHGAGPETTITLATGAAEHPVLAGIDVVKINCYGIAVQSQSAAVNGITIVDRDDSKCGLRADRMVE